MGWRMEVGFQIGLKEAMGWASESILGKKLFRCETNVILWLGMAKGSVFGKTLSAMVFPSTCPFSLSLNWPGPKVLEWLISGLTETGNSILIDTSMIGRWILFNNFWVRSGKSP